MSDSVTVTTSPVSEWTDGDKARFIKEQGGDIAIGAKMLGIEYEEAAGIMQRFSRCVSCQQG